MGASTEGEIPVQRQSVKVHGTRNVAMQLVIRMKLKSNWEEK